MTMRLLSYNIHKGIGGRDRRYRLERVIQVIQDEDPDLICLQEVDRHLSRSRHDDQPKKLAEASKRRRTCIRAMYGSGTAATETWCFRAGRFAPANRFH